MRQHKRLLSRILAGLWFLETCVFFGAQSATSKPVEMHEKKVMVYVSNATYSCATGIHFNWSIKNMSPATIYVYAPYLRGQAADRLEYDTSTSTIRIPTSMKGDSSFPPYSYPEPTFRTLAPQQQDEGDFHEPISAQVSCKNFRPKKLVFEIAWGTDTGQVLAEITRVQQEGRVHPANPIVHWATLARSRAVSIKYVERN